MLTVDPWAMAFAFKLHAYKVAALLRLDISDERAFSFMLLASVVGMELVETVMSLTFTDPQPEPAMVKVLPL